MVSQRRDDNYCPTGVAGRIIRVNCHEWRFPVCGSASWNEHHWLHGWRTFGVLGEHEFMRKKSIQYLGVSNIKYQCVANLARLMLNIGGPREAKKRLLVRLVHLKLPDAAPACASAFENYPIQRRLFSAQKGVSLRIISKYRTVSTDAVVVLTSVPPTDLLAKESQETFLLNKVLTCTSNQQVITSAKEAIYNEGRHTQTRREMANKIGWWADWKMALTWCKHFLAMYALMRTWSALRRVTMSRVATAVPLLTMRSMHSLSASGWVYQGRPLVRRRAMSFFLTR